jgi:hypothetical protein
MKRLKKGGKSQIDILLIERIDELDTVENQPFEIHDA